MLKAKYLPAARPIADVRRHDSQGWIKNKELPSKQIVTAISIKYYSKSLELFITIKLKNIIVTFVYKYLHFLCEMR